MSPTPLVSLVMVVKNGMPFVKDAVSSVINQTYKNIELIIQDSRSADGTLEYLQSIKNIKFIRIVSEDDKSREDAWNKALKRCRGEIIGSIDSDNLLHQDAVKKVVAFFKKGSKCALLYGATKNIDATGNLLDKSNVKFRQFNLLHLLRCEIVPPFASVFFLRKKCQKKLWIDPKLTTSGDFDLLLRLSGFGIKTIPDILSYTRVHSKSATINGNYRQFCIDKIQAVKNFINENRLDKSILANGLFNESKEGIYLWAAESVYKIEGDSKDAKFFFGNAKSINPYSVRLIRLMNRIRNDKKFSLKKFFLNPTLVKLFTFSFILALIIGLLSFIITYSYFINQPVWIEQAAYSQFPNLIHLESFQNQNKLDVILQMLQGERHILQSLIPGIINPQLLGLPLAHFLVTIPALFIFLFFLSWTIYKISGSQFNALLAMLLFCSFSGLLNERWGIGSGFADYQSFLFFSCSMLSLINAFRAPVFWIPAFGFFVTLTILSRTTSIFYLITLSLPILLFIFWKSWTGLNWPQLIKSGSLLLVTSGMGLIAAFYQFGGLYSFYSSPSPWGLGHSTLFSLHTIIQLFRDFIGIPTLLIMCFLVLIHAIWAHGLKIRFPIYAIVGFWWFFGFLGLLLSKGYFSDVPKEVMYASPPLVLLLSTRVNFRKNTHKVLIILILIVSIFGNFRTSLTNSTKTTPAQLNLKLAQNEMAKVLANIQMEKLTWQSYAPYDWGIPVSVLTHFNHNKFRKSYNQLFHNKKNYWDARYPGLTLSEVQKKVYGQTLSCIDIAITLKNLQGKPDGMEEYSFNIAKYVSEKIRAEKHWRYYSQLSSLYFKEPLVVYINQSKKRRICS